MSATFKAVTVDKTLHHPTGKPRWSFQDTAGAIASQGYMQIRAWLSGQVCAMFAMDLTLFSLSALPLSDAISCQQLKFQHITAGE